MPVDIQLCHEDHIEIESVLKTLTQLEILTKYLQSSDRHLYEVQTAFSKSITLFPFLQDHCAIDSGIISDPFFKSAVGKIQQHQILGESLKLSTKKAHCVQHLKKNANITAKWQQLDNH